MRTEPAITVGTVSALVSAILVLLVALGVPISEDVQTAVIAVIAAAGPIVGAAIIRGKVWSDESHRADKAKAIDETARAYGDKDLPDA